MQVIRLPVHEPIAEDFDAAICAFLFACKIRNLSERTIRFYREKLNIFAKFASSKGETPATFSTQTVNAFIHHRLQTCLPQTVNSDLRAIKSFASWLVKEGIRADNPTKGVERLKEPIPFPRTLSDEQIVALVNEIAKHSNTFAGLRDLALVCLLLDTGIRVSEAVELKLSDVDLSQGFVRVLGKGRKERVIPLGNSVCVVLYRYLLRRSSITNAGDWFFISTLGTKLKRHHIHERLRSWAKKAGIEGVRVSPHSLRFTFVRKWLQSGGDSIVLQRILGHSTPIMTSYYARLFASDLKDAHKRHSPIDALAPALKIPRRRLT